MAKHTPGPWEFSLYFPGSKVKKLGNDGSAYVTANDVGSICTVLPIKKAKRGQGHLLDDEERDANAKLIAACPSMYDALQKIANGDYDNAHDPKAAAKIALAALPTL